MTMKGQGHILRAQYLENS